MEENYVEGCNGPDWDRRGKVICQFSWSVEIKKNWTKNEIKA